MSIVNIDHNDLPEGKDWPVGKTYRIKAVVKKTSGSEDSSSFDVVDATSLESSDKGKRYFLSEGGAYRA